MQIVLKGNRVVAYGEDCFLSMGGTVVCNDTGKAYSNATIAEVDALPADIDTRGYEYLAGRFVPCMSATMAAGTYVGTGTFDRDNPCTLTFDFPPKLVWIYRDDMHSSLFAQFGATTNSREGYINDTYTPGHIEDFFTWDGFSFSWYSEVSSYQGQGEPEGTMQLNEEGVTYHYLAIGF